MTVAALVVGVAVVLVGTITARRLRRPGPGHPAISTGGAVLGVVGAVLVGVSAVGIIAGASHLPAWLPNTSVELAATAALLPGLVALIAGSRSRPRRRGGPGPVRRVTGVWALSGWLAREVVHRLRGRTTRPAGGRRPPGEVPTSGRRDDGDAMAALLALSRAAPRDRDRDREQAEPTPEAWALACLEAEPRGPAGGPAELLHRACCALSNGLSLSGAVGMFNPVPGARRSESRASAALMAWSDEAARSHSGVEAVVGEGPATLAARLGRPVLVPDLDDPGPYSWPGFAASAHEVGLRGVYAFPLMAAHGCVGVLVAFTVTHRPAEPNDRVRGLALARLVVSLLVEAGELPAAAGAGSPPAQSVRDEDEVHQAQDLITAALDVPLETALVRMRAHAFATGCDLPTLARAIIAGEVELDGPPG